MLVPIFHPVLRSCPAPAVGENDRRYFFTLGFFRNAEPSKNGSWFALIIERGVEDRLEIRSGIGPLHDFVFRRFVQITKGLNFLAHGVEIWRSRSRRGIGREKQGSRKASGSEDVEQAGFFHIE